MKFISFLIVLIIFPLTVSGGEKLTGTPIGTVRGLQYTNNGSSSYVVNNIQKNAFDGDLNTYFATDARSYTWVGLDLGKPHVIDRVGWSPRNDGVGPKRVQLGVIQGANQSDWLDAVPLYMITEEGVIGEMSYADIDVKRGFRYIRYVGPSDARCNIAELEFYGYEGEGDTETPNLYQFTNLPTVCINTVNAEEPYDKEHDITSNIIIVNNHEAYVDKPGTVRERGNYSRTFPKKPWRIKFDKKQRVLPDAPAQAKKWTLINNYGDKTLMRNLIAFEIARRMDMKYVPYAHPVDVILNGEFKGCYQLCDQVEVKEGRLEITEMEPTDISGEALTGGYFLEIDAYANQEPDGEWFTSATKSIPVTIKSPDDGGTPEQYEYIRTYFNKLESLVFRYPNYNPGPYDYRNIFDVESFLKHFAVGELSGNTDTYWSTYMYKDRGSDIIYTGPVWDFDIAFDNDFRTYPINNIPGYLYCSGRASEATNMINFAKRILMADTRTVDDLARVWSLARNDNNLNYETLSAFIDKTADEIDASQKLNFLRWPIMDQIVHNNPVVSGSYEAELNRVKDFLKNRFPRLDTLMKYDSTISAVETPSDDAATITPVIEGNTVHLTDYAPFDLYTIDGKMVQKNVTRTVPLASGVYILRTSVAAAKLSITPSQK